jgi:putative aldouronate transport system substrate-binding protein
MKKKMSGLIALSLLMAISTGLTACGSSNNESAKNNTEKTNTAKNDTKAANLTPDGQERKGKVSVMIYDRGLIPASEGTYDNNRWTKWIQENAPFEEVKFVIVPRTEAPQKMNMLFAAGEGPDVVANYEDVGPFIAKGQALEITDDLLAKMPNYKKVLDENPALKKLTTVDGKLYTVGTISPISPNHTAIIREDWLKKLNLEVPKTPEELLAVAKAFTEQDPDGNGKNDTYGTTMNADSRRVLSHMFGFGNPEIYAVEDGKLTHVWDRMQDWLTFAKQIVDAKTVDPDFLLDKGDKALTDFTNGKVGIFLTGKLSQLNSPTFVNFKKSNPTAKLEAFDLPATKYGTFEGYVNGGPSIVGFINSATKDPDAAARYINWLTDPKVSNYLVNGPDGVYKKRDAEGTVVVVDPEKNKIEYDYAADYSIIRTFDLTDSSVSPLANEYYNSYLKSSDPLLQEFGVLYYKMAQIVNKPGAIDPRKWQQTLPALSSELLLKETNGLKAVDDLLLKSLANTGKTAEQAIAEAKELWEKAGGEDVDVYYNQYYAEHKDQMLSTEDFEGLKREPELLPSAKANFDKQ